MLAPNPIPQTWSPVTRRVVRRPGYVLRYDGRHRGPSPAMKAMFAAAEANGRRWAQRLRDAMGRYRDAIAGAIPTKRVEREIMA